MIQDSVYEGFYNEVATGIYIRCHSYLKSEGQIRCVFDDKVRMIFVSSP